jgi:UV DNA damage endonuclease
MKGIEELKRRAIENLKDLKTVIQWNYENNIHVYRLSSEMFPHMSNPLIPLYSFDFAIPLLREAGELAKQYSQRLTFHPGQFNNLGSPRDEVVYKTIIELDRHCEIMDLMGLDHNSVMVIHGGGIYGNKTEAVSRFKLNFKKLKESTQKRLVLENCEKSYSTEDCLEICNSLNMPMVFDTHHYVCYDYYHKTNKIPQQSPQELIPKILETWKRRNIKPKFHVSEQGSGKVGHHSDYVEVIPEYLLEIPKKYGIKIDIMIEAKKKEMAIEQLVKKYNDIL